MRKLKTSRHSVFSCINYNTPEGQILINDTEEDLWACTQQTD